MRVSRGIRKSRRCTFREAGDRRQVFSPERRDVRSVRRPQGLYDLTKDSSAAILHCGLQGNVGDAGYDEECGGSTLFVSEVGCGLRTLEMKFMALFTGWNVEGNWPAGDRFERTSTSNLPFPASHARLENGGSIVEIQESLRAA